MVGEDPLFGLSRDSCDRSRTNRENNENLLKIKRGERDSRIAIIILIEWCLLRIHLYQRIFPRNFASIMCKNKTLIEYNNKLHAEKLSRYCSRASIGNDFFSQKFHAYNATEFFNHRYVFDVVLLRCSLDKPIFLFRLYDNYRIFRLLLPSISFDWSENIFRQPNCFSNCWKDLLLSVWMGMKRGKNWKLQSKC